MSGFVKYGRYRALAAGIFLLAMAIMIGCSGMVPASALDLIGMPSGSLKVAGVAAGKYEGDYEVAVPAGIFAAFRKFRVAVNVTADEKVDSIVILDPALMNDAEFFLPIRD
ncbi:MAG TPA: hypothetical protein DIC34_07455, partial [Treponema sp.]|nr:hypothetical protein [Treponema sp.]